MHACCAPCSVKCVETLRKEGIEPSILWSSPNIHPYTEYENRRLALVDFCAREKLALSEEGAYGLREFLAGVAKAGEPRCRFCYESKALFDRGNRRRESGKIRTTISVPRLSPLLSGGTDRGKSRRALYAKILWMYLQRRRTLFGQQKCGERNP